MRNQYTPQWWLVVSFPIIGFVIEITKDILHFLREFRKESKQRGGALATLSFFKSVFLQKIKSFEFFKTFHNWIVSQLQILRYHIILLYEIAVKELFIARIVLPHRLLNYFIGMSALLVVYLHHQYIMEVRCLEMELVDGWNDVNEIYRMHPRTRWWKDMVPRVGEYYFAWILILNFYFWPSLFLPRVYRWLSFNSFYLWCFWFSEFEIRFEPYVWTIMHYMYSSYYSGYYPLVLWQLLLVHGSSFGEDMEEMYEMNGVIDDMTEWERVAEPKDAERFWEIYAGDIIPQPNLMSDWLKDFVSDRREMFGFLVPDDYEKRVYHPNSKLFFSVYHTGLDELWLVFEAAGLESTEFHDDDDPLYSIKEFATFANRTESTAIEMDLDKTFLENFEDQNYHEIFYRSGHSNEFGCKPYVLFKYSDLRDLFLIYKYDEQIDIEQLVDWWESFQIWKRKVAGAIVQFVVFRYFRRMLGVVGPYTLYSPRYDLISRFRRKHEYHELLYLYYRSIKHYRWWPLKFSLKSIGRRSFFDAKQLMHEERHRRWIHVRLMKYDKGWSETLQRLVVNNKSMDEIMNGYPAFIDLHKIYYSYIFMNPGHFLVDPMWEKLKKPKVYVALPIIHGYLNNFVWITDLGFIRKVCWLRIKQFFRWLNPINWWKRRKALKVLLRFERESRALVRNNKRNFKFFMVDKATENKEKNNDLDRHDYPNENNDSK